MTDTETLNELIEQAGLKKDYIAKQLGITPTSLSNKIYNKTKFTQGEIIALQQVLRLSDEDTQKILM